MKNALMVGLLLAGVSFVPARVAAMSVISEVSSTSVSHTWDDDHSTSYDYAYMTSGDSITYSSSTGVRSFSVSLPDTYQYDIESTGGYQTLQIWLRFGDSMGGDEVPGVNLSSFSFANATGTEPTISNYKLYYDSSDGSIAAYLYFNSIPSNFSFTGVDFTFNNITGLGSGTKSINTSTSNYTLSTTVSNGQFLTVSSTSVPKPSSYAAFLGIAGLGGALMMRRRTRR